MKIELADTQKVLSPTQITIADYAINPYKGCEFQCLYCYAQKNKNMPSSGQPRLSVKINAAEILEKELRYKTPKRVLLGSTTECFPRIEPEYGITGKILKLLNKNSIPYTILTKSDLIAGYLDIISANPSNEVYFTLNFNSDRIIKILEQNSPLTAARQETIKKIINRNIKLRVHVGPYIPHLFPVTEIFSLIPQGVSKVNIELYHHKMGNFTMLLEKIRDNFPLKIKNDIINTYKDKNTYLSFAGQLKDELLRIKSQYPFKVFYIVPEYDNFYTPDINYADSL